MVDMGGQGGARYACCRATPAPTLATADRPLLQSVRRRDPGMRLALRTVQPRIPERHSQDMTPFRRLITELRERKVFRAAGAYLAAAFVTIQVADLLVVPLALPLWTMRLVILLLAVGFPVVIALSWTLEVTGGGVRRAPSGEVQPEDMRLRRRVLAGVIGVVALLVAGSITAWAVRDDVREVAARSIAVLPFVDLSPAGDQRYFSDGLTEELTIALSRVDGLQVAARTAAFQFEGASADLTDVAQRLNVTTVLEGSVRRADDQLRVTVRLVDVATGFELWTQVYNRLLSDVFAVQEDIAREVLNALRFPEAQSALTHPGTRNLEAYDQLLRGNHLLARRTPDGVRGAIASYEAAARADPGFATPQFRQAYAYLIYADWGWRHPELDAGELLRRAAALIDAGLALEPASAEGWLARAYLHVLRDPFGMAGALAAFERSLSLDGSSAEAWHQYGQTLMVLGRFDDAAAAYHRALRAEPQRSMTLVPLAAIALYRGHTDEALRWADSALAIDPANSYARAGRARIHLAAGNVLRARADAEVAAGVGSAHAIPVTATLAAALALSAATEEARAAFEEALRLAGSDTLPVVDAPYMAMAAAALGDRDQAVALLRRARPQGAWFWFYLQTPLLDALRDDPRFQQLVSAADPRRRATQPLP
jgi:adenylate cyclase